MHGILGKQFLPNVPKEEQNRPYAGRTLDLNRIERAIIGSNRGFMRSMTDLSLETLTLDGHASSVIQKRLNRLAALPWEVVPATGEGVNEQQAEDAAGLVRDNLEMIPRFRQKIIDTGWAAYHGRSAQELFWGFNGRKWWVGDLHWVHPRRLSFGPNRDIRVVDLTSDRGNFADVGFAIEDVPYKFLTYKPRLFGDYQEREGLARRFLYWSFFARFGTRERMALMEIFGKPWRIVMPKEGQTPTALNREALTQSFDAINSLGANSTARLPMAMDVQIPQPATNAGQIHEEAIDYANKIISKLALGQTGTTDAVSTGLGSSVGDVHASEEDLIIAADAWNVAEAIEDQLTDAIVIVNHGAHAVRYAPKFVIRTDPPQDRTVEAALIKSAQEVGLRVAEQEAMERLGFREVRDADTVLVPPPPPTAAGMFTMQGAPETPLSALPVAQPDTEPKQLDGDPVDPALQDDSRQVLADKMTEAGVKKCEHNRPNRCPMCGVERVRDFELGPDGEPVWSIKWRPIGGGSPLAVLAEDDAEQVVEELSAMAGAHANRQLAAGQKPTNTVFGSPETLVKRGVTAAAEVTGKLAAAIVGAIEGKKTARAIMAAARGAVRKFNTGSLEDVLEREIIQGSMLGALDADWEGRNERPVQVETFADLWPESILLASVEPPFAGHPRQEALEAFSSRNVVTRDVFDSMQRAAKARAFTVAGAATDTMLAAVQAELTAQIATGAALVDFGRNAAERLKSAGWTPQNSSHLETVFRTNVNTAYSDGRYKQITDPVVMAARPYTQILTVTDSRRRLTHGKAHLWVFKTEDLTRGQLTPFGYNCRCRFRSLSERQVKGLTIHDPSELAAIPLPDPGFN